LSLTIILEKILSDSLIQKGKTEIGKISTDTRILEKGALFLALTGEKFDGHDFLQAALEKGAGGILIQKNHIPDNLPSNIWCFAVEDTLKAYQDIAMAVLEAKKILKIAVTGTSGKTTTKEFIRALLSVRYKVFANQGNFNNQVGVPLSILQTTDEEIGIFELGAGKPGDIHRLSEIVKPDIALVTSIGEGHLEFFGSVENVAKEKASIMDFGKQGFCPADILFPVWFSKFQKVNFSSFSRILSTEDGYQITIQNNTVFLPFWGEYNLFNFLTALTIALELDVREDQIQDGINRIKLPSYRQEKKEKEGRIFYLDCYNANPLSMKSALSGFEKLEGEKIAVLGDMLELGRDEEVLHSEIGKFLNQFSFKKVLFYGRLMKKAFEAYQKEKNYFNDKNDLALFLKNESKKGDKIFIKASRGMKLEEIFNLY